MKNKLSKEFAVIFSCVILVSYVLSIYLDFKLAPVIVPLIFSIIYFSFKGNK